MKIILSKDDFVFEVDYDIPTQNDCTWCKYCALDPWSGAYTYFCNLFNFDIPKLKKCGPCRAMAEKEVKK